MDNDGMEKCKWKINVCKSFSEENISVTIIGRAAEEEWVSSGLATDRGLRRSETLSERPRITSDNFLTGWPGHAPQNTPLFLIIVLAVGVSWKFLGVYVLAVYSVVRRTPHKFSSL